MIRALSGASPRPTRARNAVARDVERVGSEAREVRIQHGASEPALVEEHELAAVGEVQGEARPDGVALPTIGL
jgi:hypothetical protein